MKKSYEALSCLRCGSNDLSYENGFLVCSYCKTKHLLVNNSLVIVEKYEMYQTADSYLEWKQYDVACKKYKEIVYKWAQEPYAWWGIVRCMTEDFTKTDVSVEFIEDVKKYAMRAIDTSDSSTKTDFESKWNQYIKTVSDLINEKGEKAQERANQEALRKEVEEMRRNAHFAFLEMKTKEQKRVAKIISTISVIFLLIAVIVYIILALSLNIPGSINSSPACIGPVVVGGLISAVIVGLSSGISKFMGLFWMPAATNAVCVLFMISGMISHSPNFFMSAMVIICFGAVGAGVTALIGWISWLITCGMNNHYDSTYFAEKYVDHKYKELNK